MAVANHGAVATPRPEAAEAGKQMLLRGGNAIDAAVASMLTVCVVTQSMVGIAGYGGTMIVYLAKEKRAVALDFDSRAPLAYRDDLYMPNPEVAEHGYLSTSVPGVLAGLAEAQKRWGALPWSAVCEHAIRMCEEGIVIDAENRGFYDRWAKFADAASIKELCPGGLPEVGSRLIQKDHARLLQTISKDGADAMYHGDIPRAIVKQIRANGGILSEEDFASYKPTMVDPLTINYRGYDIYTPPPPSGGITALQILKVLENFDVSKMKPWDVEYFHHFAESSKLCWQDRARAVGDPDFVKMPMKEMLSTQSAKIKADRIRRGGIVRGDQKLPLGSSHTANICAVDGEGNVVSMTATQGMIFGSGVVIEGMGIAMGHGMSRFDFVPGHPNAPAPGKRMHHNMSPVVVMKEGKPAFAVGLPGGTKIVSVTAQLVVNVIDFKADAEQAVHSPRVHTETDEPVAVSSKVTDQQIEELKAMGHTLRRGQDVGGLPNEIGGRANAIILRDGKYSAASGRGAQAVAVV